MVPSLRIASGCGGHASAIHITNAERRNPLFPFPLLTRKKVILPGGWQRATTVTILISQDGESHRKQGRPNGLPCRRERTRALLTRGRPGRHRGGVCSAFFSCDLEVIEAVGLPEKQREKERRIPAAAE